MQSKANAAAVKRHLWARVDGLIEHLDRCSLYPESQAAHDFAAENLLDALRVFLWECWPNQVRHPTGLEQPPQAIGRWEDEEVEPQALRTQRFVKALIEKLAVDLPEGAQWLRLLEHLRTYISE